MTFSDVLHWAQDILDQVENNETVSNESHSLADVIHRWVEGDDTIYVTDYND